MRTRNRALATGFIMSFGLAIGLRANATTADEPKPPAGFTSLFNGKDLSGWKGHTTMT